MKVAVDGSVFTEQLTGIGHYVHNLLVEWAKLSPEVQFIVYAPYDLQVEFKEANIIISKPILKIGKRLNRAKKLFWFHAYLPLKLHKDQVNLFWGGNGMAPIIPVVPTILVIHDFVYKFFPETMHHFSLMHRRFVQPYAVKKAKRIVCNSQATADDLTKYSTRKCDAIIKPAVNIDFKPSTQEDISKIKDKYNLPNEYYLIVGTIEPRKNLELFMRCYLELDDIEKQGRMLVIVGRDGWKQDGINKIIEKGLSRDLFYLTGYVDQEDMPVLYSAAKAYFMPSVYEGFGMPILEARKCGCPVICSDVSAMREAGGEMAVYHTPDKKGIMDVLKKVSDSSFEFKTDFGESATWTWRSGAKQLSKLI